MSKKMFMLITGVVGGVAAIAEAVVKFAEPEYSVAICAAIPIAVTATTEILTLFIKPDSAEK